jgi:predicted alpha/beta hydrolase family esterase
MAVRLVQQRYLYHPTPGPAGNWEYGYQRTVVGDDPDANDRVFFFCHGNMGSAFQRLPWVGVFGAGHYFIHEYAGFGSRYGLDKLQRDVIIARARAALHTLPAGPLYFVGESLGTGVVCELAEEFRPRVLLLLTPYTTMTAMAQRFLPFLGPLLLQDRYNTVHYLRQLQRYEHTPRVLVVAGWEDSIIPRSQARQVAKAGSGTIIWYGGDHEDLFAQKDEWLPLLQQVLSVSLGSPPRIS